MLYLEQLATSVQEAVEYFWDITNCNKLCDKGEVEWLSLDCVKQ